MGGVIYCVNIYTIVPPKRKQAIRRMIFTGVLLLLVMAVAATLLDTPHGGLSTQDGMQHRNLPPREG